MVVADSKILTAYDVVVWRAGVLANSNFIPKEYWGPGNRVTVRDDLTLRDFSNVWVIGDLALGFPPTAQVARAEAEYVTDIIKRKIPPEKRSPFVFHSRGYLVSLGQRAVGNIGEREVFGSGAGVIEKVAAVNGLPGSFWHRCSVGAALMWDRQQETKINLV